MLFFESEIWHDVLDARDYNQTNRTAEKDTRINRYKSNDPNNPNNPSITLLNVEVRVVAIVELKPDARGRINFNNFFYDGNTYLGHVSYGYNCTVQLFQLGGSSRYLLTSNPDSLLKGDDNQSRNNILDIKSDNQLNITVTFVNNKYGTYSFNLDKIYSPLQLKIKVVIDPRLSNNFTSNNNLLSFNNQEEITIVSQTLIDGSDIGSTIFTNNDKIYEQCCPKIVSVLIGTGATMSDKLNNILLKQPVNTAPQQFILNIILYSMLRYFLSYLLYGNFDINYLLNQYTKQFLHDLKHSQYQNFLDYFSNINSPIFGYEQYFLY